MRERGGEIARQRLAVAADDRQCNRLAALRFRFAGQCAGQFRQRQAMAVAELAAQRLQITCESRDVGSAEQAQLMRPALRAGGRSEEHTSELPSLMRISSAVFCLKNKSIKIKRTN